MVSLVCSESETASCIQPWRGGGMDGAISNLERWMAWRGDTNLLNLEQSLMELDGLVSEPNCVSGSAQRNRFRYFVHIFPGNYGCSVPSVRLYPTSSPKRVLAGVGKSLTWGNHYLLIIISKCLWEFFGSENKRVGTTY